jgi:signal peptidase II
LEEREDKSKAVKVFSRLFVTLIMALVLDGLTKTWAVQALEPYQPVPIIGQIFRLTLGYNTGVAFSLFTNSGAWPLIITSIVILGLGVWFVHALGNGEFPPQAGWPIGLLFGGALANFTDRLLDGQVIDFLDVGVGSTRWPAFNLADSFIILGIALVILMKMKVVPNDYDLDEIERDASGTGTSTLKS